MGLRLSYQVQEEDKMEKLVKINDRDWSYRGYAIHAQNHNTSKKGAKYQYRFNTYTVATQDEIDRPMMFWTKTINNVMMTAKSHYSFSLDEIVNKIDQIESAK
jgi:hypothetical protein